MSLVDSLPSTPPFQPHLDSPNKSDVSPGTHTPPIKTTTNTVPHITQLQPQAVASIPSTPASGLDIPGAYPREKSGTSAGMSGPATIQSAAETAPSYLPTGLAGHYPSAKTTSLPSMEKEGAKPGVHCDGVGPLPGSISETSVAKLPDERSASVCEPGAGVAAVSLPSQETTDVQPHEHHGGVGPLPRSRSETSVAKLPDERASATRSDPTADAESQDPTVDTAAPRAPASSFAALGITGQGTQARRIDPQSLESDPERDDRRADVRKPPTETEEKKSGIGSQGDDEGKNRRVVEERTSPKEQQRLRAVPPAEPVSAPAQRKGRSSSDSDASNHKKASVLNKVKGEMKVLLGKASRNKEKVEEGEKLKHGSD